MISLRLFAGEKFRGERRTRSSRRSFVRGIPASLPQSFISERMEEERDSRSVLQCKRHLWVLSSSRYTQGFRKILSSPLRSNCDHFALRNPPLIGSNYPPTGSRSLRTKAKPTIRLVRKKEKKRRRIVPFETKGERELKIEGKEIGEGGRKRRGPRVGKTMKSLSSLPPVDGEKEDCRIARKASPRSARKNRGTLTRDWEVQPIV